MIYIATFFSHYAAVKFSRRMAMESIPAKMMPVPRRVSSSCGTGVRFETEREASGFAQEGLDRIFSQRESLYELVFENRSTA